MTQLEDLTRDCWKIFSIERDLLVEEIQISESWPPVLLSANKSQSDKFKKKSKKILTMIQTVIGEKR